MNEINQSTNLTINMIGPERFQAYTQIIGIFHPDETFNFSEGIPVKFMEEITQIFLSQKTRSEVDERLVRANAIALNLMKARPDIDLTKFNT